MKRFVWIAAALAAFLFAIKLDKLRRNVDRVVIITIDTIRADHLPFYGYPRPTSNALVQLSEEGFLFERAYAASPDLALALRSLSTSLLPFDAASPRAVPLLDRLKKNGFDVGAFSDSSELAVAIGDVPFEPSEDLMSAVRDAGHWFRDKSRGKKVAVWLHLDGSVEAANPSRVDQLAPAGPELRRFLVQNQGLPADAGGLATDAALARVRFHDARIKAVDRAIERFYSMTLNRKKPTMIIVAGCRGEAFDAADDGARLDEGMVRVPLIAWFSDDRDPGRRLGGVVRHIDVWPTVATLTLPVWKRFSWNAEGRSFASALRKKGGWSGTASTYIERASGSAALVAGHRKAVRVGDRWRLYDLTYDPLEKDDLSAADAATLRRMTRRLESLNR